MPSGMSYICSDCGRRIEDSTYPIIIYEVAGIAPLHPEATSEVVKRTGVVDLRDYPVPARIKELLMAPTSRKEMCLVCYAWQHKLDLTDAEGNVVVAFSECADRQAFAASGVTLVKTAKLAKVRAQQALSAPAPLDVLAPSVEEEPSTS